MRALYYTGTQQSELRTVPDPQSEGSNVVVAISHCGICGSDMHAWHGHDARRIPPLILGHEAVGIAQSGKHSGKRVAINPLMTCGICEPCESGNEHLCLERELIGMKVPGAFAEQVAVKEDNLYPIADKLSFAEAALAEPLAVCVHAASLGLKRITKSLDRVEVLVQGGGAIGLLTALVLKDQGVGKIWIGETNAGRRTTLEQLGGLDVFDPSDASQGPKDSSVELVLDAVGIGHTRAAASAKVKPGGTIIHIGLQDSSEGLDTRRITLQEIAFIGTYCYTNADFQEALDLLANGRITGTGWAELRPLDQGAVSFEDIHKGKAPPKIILEM
ncbi:MAG: alcohol dehydrogenase catalytic domain-containing protein [Salaquimonas sp.]